MTEKMLICAALIVLLSYSVKVNSMSQDIADLKMKAAACQEVLR